MHATCLMLLAILAQASPPTADPHDSDPDQLTHIHDDQQCIGGVDVCCDCKSVDEHDIHIDRQSVAMVHFHGDCDAMTKPS